MRKQYFLRGFFFFQEELCYEEDKQLKQEIKTVASFFAGEAEKGFGDKLEAIFDAGVVPNLLKVILKPETRIGFRHWNKMMQRISSDRFEIEFIVQKLKNSELAKIVTHFFFINSKWIPSLPDLRKIWN